MRGHADQKIDISTQPAARRRDGSAAGAVDAGSLADELRRAIEGEVRFDSAARGLYASDASNYRQIPIGLVAPRTPEDVVITHQLCHRYGAPILSRGGGTSLSGEAVNTAVVIDYSKYMRRIDAPDAVRRLIVAQPGAINEKVNEEAGKANLVFGPDPSTHSYCTIGGNIGNNSCGIHSVQSQFHGPGPRTSDNVYELEVVTHDGARFRVGVDEEASLDAIIRQGGRKGEIYRQLRHLRDQYADAIRARFRPISQLPRRVSGFNLDELLPERGFNVARALSGTEGTCASVVEATLMLTPAMLQRVTVVVAYPDLASAGDAIMDILEWKPIGLEGIDDELVRLEQKQRMNLAGLRQLPWPGEHAWLLVQFGADTAAEAADQAERFRNWLVHQRRHAPDHVRVFRSKQAGGDTESLWQIREGGLGATAFPPGEAEAWPGWEDSAVAPDQVGPYIRDLRRLYGKYGLRGAMYGHLGQGCIHSRITFDLTHADGLRTYRAFLEEASDLVVSYAGTLSGEHGDGQQRAEFLHKQYGPELVRAMREFKRIWDPDGKMNPGKVVDPYRLDENLRLGTSYNPPRPKVKFAYAEDHGDFAHAALRCVGVGKCREPEGVDVMCPSYIATREEKHTTRGRARLLFEMLQGDVIRDGWQSEEVYDALDLCLACKGCTSDCPVHVDMPTYKAEFLYHHFKSARRNRKRYMYAFGFIDQLSRIASRIPEVANFVLQAPALSDAAKLAGGVDRRRAMPAFAPMSLQAWFRRRGGTANPAGPKVLLWPDTFNNYFHTHVGVACVEALETSGFQVVMPKQHVCCGRPLYDYGFLDVAEAYLRRTLRQIRDEIRAGTPVVGMEPSCLAVFRDELTGLLPHDDDAQRLAKNSYHFAEFFLAHDLELPRLDRKAIIWGHCHQKATGGMGPERDLFRDRLGMDAYEVKGGCCGLAGSWGFEEGKYDISMQCGEAGFLPAARRAEPGTLIVADGFSCQTQLEQALGKRAVHTGQVLQLARERTTTGCVEPFRPAPALAVRVARTAAAVAAGAVATTAAIRLARAVGRRVSR